MDRRAHLLAIERVYRGSYRRFVRTAAAITGDWREGEDAVHDAFVNAVRARHSFRGEGSLEAWLWAIVVNAAKARRRDRSGPSADSVEEAAGTAIDARADFVRELVHALPERQRLALFLRYYADLDYAAIAAVLDVSKGTVAATLHAAHRALREALTEVKS